MVLSKQPVLIIIIMHEPVRYYFYATDFCVCTHCMFILFFIKHLESLKALYNYKFHIIIK